MKGLVVKSTGSWYAVICEGERYDCRLRGNFRIKDIKSTNPIVVGDWVKIDVDKDNVGMITEIYDRKNYIIRKSTNLSRESQILASNIDMAFLVVTLKKPETHLAFIDRFLASCEAYKVPVTLVFNKIDLLNENDLLELEKIIDIYRHVPYETLKISVLNKIGLLELKSHLKGKVCIFAGNSGVGKSTIVNHLFPDVNQRTSAVSQSHNKGTHTTTFVEMFIAEEDTFIIDSPGIKSFGMTDLNMDELSHYFPEMFALLTDCKFFNCTHTHEPDCAVKQGVENGKVSQSRYLSYLNIFNEKDEKYRY